ncbi:MAG: DMT family transporter [Rhodobiaceae bacterium]|nr:DMT family transporter [Rhodobiaceae bacterium]MCC0049685.1 DMT family transporter [Rhodobiaceae bacterium]
MSDAQPDTPAVSAAATLLSENRRGIISMLIAMFGFITNDACVKLAGETLPLGMIIFVRGMMASAMLAALAVAMRQVKPIPRTAWKPLGGRIVGEWFATLLYLTALLAMPLANATAILQAMPLVMTVLAAFLFKEKVGWRRWSAIACGFVGMLMVVQPGMEGFDSNALYAVAALGFVALRDLSNRFIDRDVPTVMVTLVTMIAATGMGAVMVLIEGFERWPDAREMAILAAAGGFLSIGYYAITDAMRTGELSVVALFRYSIIVWAFVLGYFIWGDIPGLLRLAGIVLIVSSGLFVIYRERVKMRKLQAALKA